jgi:hypothetical protein
MLFRRGFYYWQFIAALLLPVWVLVGRGIVSSGIGWDFVLYLVLCPILCVAMLAVAGLTAARKGVRSTKAVSWLDVAAGGAWHAAIVLYGFFSSAPLATVIVLLAIAAFWVAAWQLFTETRQRVKNALSLDPIDAGPYSASPRPGTPDPSRVIIVNPDGSREELPDR